VETSQPAAIAVGEFSTRGGREGSVHDRAISALTEMGTGWIRPNLLFADSQGTSTVL